MDLKLLEKRACGKSYPEVEAVLPEFDDPDLLHLLDSRSIRVGDTATEILITRRQTDLRINALLERINGRINGDRSRYRVSGPDPAMPLRRVWASRGAWHVGHGFWRQTPAAAAIRRDDGRLLFAKSARSCSRSSFGIWIDSARQAAQPRRRLDARRAAPRPGW